MRRRDAINSLLHSRPLVGRRNALPFAVSLALHAALLVLLSFEAFRAAEPARLVMVSLIASGGGVPQPAGAAPAQPQTELRQTQPPSKVLHARRHASTKAGALAVAVAPTPAADPSSPSTGDADGSAVASVGVGSGGLGGTGSGRGGGSGDGTGAGDQRAHCVVCPEPSYPLVARRRGWQGTVDVGLVLLADGSVATAEVRRSCGHEVLDREAVAVARRSRFSPLRSAPASGHIAYRFELAAPRP